MDKSKYGSYIYRRLIRKSAHPEIIAPTVSFKLKKGSGDTDISVDWCYISQPVLMGKRPVVDGLDRFLIFAGGDPLNLDDFQAEVEISLGEKGEKFKFNGPRVVYLPKGLVHYPLTIKNIEKPIMLLDITSAREYTRKEISDYAQYITSPSIGVYNMVTRTYRNDKLIREQKGLLKS